MGQKRKERPSSDELLSTISQMLVPAHILEHFEIYGAKESRTSWVIEMREKEDLIPAMVSDYDDVDDEWQASNNNKGTFKLVRTE